MLRVLTYIIMCVLAALGAAAGEPFCRIVTYDENSGLSQHLVKQIVEDADGMMWFATWNGINRFDGYEFVSLRPEVNDDVRRYSSRFRDLKLSSAGNLWCRIDDKIVSLDTRSYRFDDFHSQLEKKFGRRFEMSRWWQTIADELVIECADGSFIIVPEKAPENARLATQAPSAPLRSPGNRAFARLGAYDNLAYSRSDPDGTLWAVTRDGLVISADSLTAPLKTLADLGLGDGSARYCTTDSEGNVWIVSSKGAHALTLDRLPFARVNDTDGETLIAIFKDSKSRVWTADRNRLTVKIYDSGMKRPAYLGADGSLSERFASFGSPVYSVCETPDGNIWLGSKPDGLFRLTPSGAGYRVSKIAPGNVYDITMDKKGRLWVATLGDGVMIIENPAGDSPVTRRLNERPGYPKAANACRKLTSLGDSLMLVATTGGLLSVNIDRPDDMRLFTTVPGDLESLGCIAIMDILPRNDGSILLATESDAVNVARKDAEGRLRFSQLPSLPSSPSEVALSISEADTRGGLLVVSHNLVYTLDSVGNTRVLSRSFWHDNVRFRECRPVRLDDGKWVFGLEDGLIVSDLAGSGSAPRSLRPAFTSVSIENRPDSLLPAFSRRIVLTKDERNLSLRFSALAHSGLDDIVYESRIDDGDWTRTGRDHSITLLDLEPGTFTLEVRASDLSGRRKSETVTILITVQPKWHETPAAQILFGLLVGLAIFLAIRLWLYVRGIKRKQRETLEAYMSLLAKNMKDRSEEAAGDDVSAPQPSPILADEGKKPALTDADRQFMDKIVDYVNSHLSDPEAGVDAMAEAAMVSRSGLSRKMRSLTGVSPADFLKQARLSHAATLLLTTTLSVKEIAFDCGFADLNYFGKCFKSAYTLSPNVYRKKPNG